MSSIIEVVALALQRTSDSRFMLARRGPNESGAGYWEFPGGKVERGETQRQALVREIGEELSLKIKPELLVLVAQNDHQYGAKVFRIFLWKCVINADPLVSLIDHDQIMWCDSFEMRALKVSAGDVTFIEKLL